MGHDDGKRGMISPGIAEIDDFERSDGERDEIAGQRTGGGEADELHVVSGGAFRGWRGIGDGEGVARNAENNLPGSFPGWLVETGKGAAGIGGLELGVEVPAIIFPESEDAGAALAVDFAGVGEVGV